MIVSTEYGKYVENHTEVETYEYNKIVEWSNEFEQIKYIVSTKYYEDGIIEKREYNELQTLYVKLATIRDRKTKLPNARKSLDEVISK